MEPRTARVTPSCFTLPSRGAIPAVAEAALRFSRATLFARYVVQAFLEDLKKLDVPTHILHGNDDQIVPIGASALLSPKVVKGARLKVYSGAPHGLCTTHFFKE